MENPQPQPIAFKITRLGKEPEEVRADSCRQDEGKPPKYIFEKQGRIVLDLFVHALESEPKAVYPQTPEQRAKWREFARRNNVTSDYLKR